jgi:hypothetical protein
MPIFSVEGAIALERYPHSLLIAENAGSAIRYEYDAQELFPVESPDRRSFGPLSIMQGPEGEWLYHEDGGLYSYDSISGKLYRMADRSFNNLPKPTETSDPVPIRGLGAVSMEGTAVLYFGIPNRVPDSGRPMYEQMGMKAVRFIDGQTMTLLRHIALPHRAASFLPSNDLKKIYFIDADNACLAEFEIESASYKRIYEPNPEFRSFPSVILSVP